MAEIPDAVTIVGVLADASEAADAARILGRLPVALSLEIGDQRVVLSSAGPQVVVRAPLAVWLECLGAVPPAGSQSVGALLRSQPDWRIDGDALAVAQSLALLEIMVETARDLLARRTRDVLAPTQGLEDFTPPVESLDRIEGRYVPVTLPGLGRTWLYEESAGARHLPVMLMLHTAGADSRQWHSLMTDERLLADWRMVAFDMPLHGRSNPPLHWSGKPWQLNTGLYLETIDAYLDAAQIGRVLIVGCSMGAAAGLAYVAERPDRVHGAILLEAPFRSPGRTSPFLDHPAVHAGRISAAWVQALLSPLSPIGRRRRATWIYGQGGPGVYEGDLGFYSDEFDAGVYVDRIDTRRSPLWLLTGEYDYSATPQDSRRIADAIPGARFQTMPGLGHFPMVENPAALMTWLHPITAGLARTLGAAS